MDPPDHWLSRRNSCTLELEFHHICTLSISIRLFSVPSATLERASGFSPRYHSPNEVERIETVCSGAFHSAYGSPTGLDRGVRHSYAKNCVATIVTTFFDSTSDDPPGVLKGPCDTTHGGITCDSHHTIVNS
jgi:hypothetical protein